MPRPCLAALAPALALAGLPLTVPALAQTSANAPGTIIVTGQLEAYQPIADVATRTGTPALEVPFVSDAVGAGLLEDRGLLTLTDALRTVPGTAPVTGIGNFNTRFRLRGFVSNNILRNGYRQALGFSVTDVAHIDRIEVLKGPASALYGRFEPGGTINIVTKQPLTTNRYQAGFTADAHGLLRGTVDLNWAASDRIQLRLNGAYEHGESFRDFVTNDTAFVAPTAAITLGPRTRLVLEGEYSERDGVFDRGFVSNRLLLTLPPERFLGDPDDTYRNTTHAGSALLEHGSLDDVRLRIGASWSRSRSDGDYYFPIAAGGAPLVSATGVLNRRLQTTFDVQRDWSAMAELATRATIAGVANTLLVAIDYNRDRSVSLIRRASVNAGLNVLSPVYGGTRAVPNTTVVDTVARNEAVGGLVQLETAWTDWLRTTGGVRLEQVRTLFRDQATGRSGRATETALTPRAGLTLLPGDGFAMFANYGRSFAPEVTTRPIVGGNSPEPSRGTQYEAGVRWERADGSVRASASLFRITRTNIRVAEPGGSPFDRQVGAQRSQGFELDFAAQPVAALRLELAYAYVDAEVTRDPALAGRRLQSTPAHSASLWARWDITPRWGVGGGVFMVSDRFVDTANSFALDGQARADAALYWRPLDHVDLQLNLLNMFDARGFENGNTNNNFYPSPPRTLRGTLRVTF